MKALKRSSIFYGLILSAALGVLASGCSKTGSSTPTVNTYVSLMNLASYSPATEVYFNNSKSTVSMNPGQIFRSYAPLKPGSYAVQFKKSGSDSVMAKLDSTSYDSLAFNTVIMYNPNALAPAAAIKIKDDFRTVTNSTTTFRFFNLCANVPPVDLYFSTTMASARRTNADIVGNPGYWAFQPFTPGTYNIIAKKAGSDSVIAQVNNFNLIVQNAYTVILQGMAGSGSTNPVSLSVLQASF